MPILQIENRGVGKAQVKRNTLPPPTVVQSLNAGLQEWSEKPKFTSLLSDKAVKTALEVSWRNGRVPVNK